MRTSTTITKHPEKSVEKIICNGCGKVAKHLDCNNITPIDIEFSYGSENDGQSWSLDLCDTCIEDIASKFKIPVRKGNV